MLAKRRRTRRVGPVASLALLTLGVAGVAQGASFVRAVQEGDDLVGRLATLENELVRVPALPDVTVSPEETWGIVNGDFVGWSLDFEQVAEELESLHVAAEDAEGPIADAVATVSRSHRRASDAVRQLAAYAERDLVFPLDTRDADSVATGADEARGNAEVGLKIMLANLDPFIAGYAVLRDAPELTAEQRNLFGARYQAVFDAEMLEAPDTRLALSLPVDWELQVTSRFDVRFPGDAHARVLTLRCIDRDEYRAARSAGADPALLAASTCPDLNVANDNELRLVPPESVATDLPPSEIPTPLPGVSPSPVAPAPVETVTATETVVATETAVVTETPSP